MPFIFERFAVVVAFHAEFRDDLTGTEQELADFDVALNQRYANFFRGALEKHGLPDTREVRSMAVLLAKLSSGSAKTQLDNACEYYASTRPALPAGPIAFAEGAGVTASARPARRGRGRRTATRGAKRAAKPRRSAPG